MRITLRSLFLLFIGFTLGFCSKEPEANSGELTPTHIEITADGEEIVSKVLFSSAVDYNGGAFEFSENGSFKSGLWTINENNTLLEVEFEGIRESYDIIEFGSNEFIIKALSFSTGLTRSSLERDLMIFIYNNMLSNPDDWDDLMRESRSIEVFITIKTNS